MRKATVDETTHTFALGNRRCRFPQRCAKVNADGDATGNGEAVERSFCINRAAKGLQLVGFAEICMNFEKRPTFALLYIEVFFAVAAHWIVGTQRRISNSLATGRLSTVAALRARQDIDAIFR